MAQCESVVWRRDRYRLKRGKGFTLRYERSRCRRKAKTGGLCAQHHRLNREFPGYSERVSA